MIKILYDIPPFSLLERQKSIIAENGFIGVAVCTSREKISAGLYKILSGCGKEYQMVAWTRADERAILHLRKHIKGKCYLKEMESVGFVTYSLPEMSFVLGEEDVQNLLECFDQLSSLEIYCIHEGEADKIWGLLAAHPPKIDCSNILGFLQNSEMIINKSGDEDELEFTVKAQQAKSILDVFLTLP